MADVPDLQHSDSCSVWLGRRKVGYQDTKVGQSNEPGFIMDLMGEPLLGGGAA